MKYWPEGISISDTSSPLEILEQAREEWETVSDGELTLSLHEDNGAEKRITVHAKKISTNQTAALFTVRHGIDTPYPVFIEDPLDEKTWVSVCPQKFRLNLAENFQFSGIKSIVSNLLISKHKQYEKGEINFE